MTVLRGEQGSMVLGVGLAAVVVMVAVAVGSVGAGIAAYVHAANGADAAALAAAPVTFRPFGADGTPAAEAARFAGLNGVSLVRCICAIDHTWDTRTVEVVVAHELIVPIVGTVTVRATSRATFEPVALIP
ncbi:MAG: hypothetical protein ACR2N7_10750 [Acidimicrobiia bacterium]